MKKLWKSLLASPAVFCAMLVISAAAVAGEIPASRKITEPPVVSPDEKSENIRQDNGMAQVNSVSLYLITFSCSIGSFFATTPKPPKKNHFENLW